MIHDRRTVAAETIQRWWIAWRFIRANPRMVMVVHMKRGQSFRSNILYMTTYLFEDLTAQTIDYMIDGEEKDTFRSANQIKREILRQVGVANTFNLVIAAKDEITDDNESFLPTQWIVLGD